MVRGWVVGVVRRWCKREKEREGGRKRESMHLAGG